MPQLRHGFCMRPMTRTITSSKLLVRAGSVALFLLFAFSSAHADRSISFAQAAPDVVFVNTSTQVTVTATIGADSALLTNSVYIIRLDTRGPAAIVGRLYDNGTHGDEQAGDNIYTGQISLSETNIGDIRFVVSTAYRGGLKRLTSS